jgi:hypothetical protein
MLTHLKLSSGAAAGTATTMVKESRAAQTRSESSTIKRKIAAGDNESRENQLYTRAWAIYSRARNRRVARAVSIL